VACRARAQGGGREDSDGKGEGGIGLLGRKSEAYCAASVGGGLRGANPPYGADPATLP
jgi:hypothetical protein